MSDPIISVHNLGKRFHLGESANHDTLRDHLTMGLKKLIGRGGQRTEKAPEMWALREVSFDIAPGEVIGVVGRNGAGKSTLLKILAQISEPTEGEVRIRGRVASLLEVGTGFHSELTGRENIFLSGAILGMSRAEIVSKFDQIVAFSEVEAFLSTPVKHYSSGMAMRLAFAVAAHLEPEILLIDEVLAVGDAAFQKKCLGKMDEVARGGRTILFVSHNLATVAQLCTRAILLERGRMTGSGSPEEIIQRYTAGSGASNDRSWEITPERLATTAKTRITSAEMLTLEGSELTLLSTGDGVILRLGYSIESGQTIPSASFVIRVKSGLGTELFRMGNTPLSGFPIDNLSGTGTVDLVLPNLHLAAGRYLFDVAVACMGQGFYHDAMDVGSFTVEKRDVYGSGHAIDHTRGLCVVPHRWIVRRADAPQIEDSGWIGPQLLSTPTFIPKQNT